MHARITLTAAAAFAATTMSLEAPMAQTNTPDWVRVAEHANWAARDSCGEVVYDGKMWLSGGWFSSNIIGPRDVWSSADGANWTRATETAGWKHGDLPMTATFRNRMWFMGGWYAGRLPEGGASNEVWASTDGAHWDCVTPAAAWSPRIGAGLVEFEGKLWLLGGLERYFDPQPQHLRSDVWSSADGAMWEQVTPAAPWAGRAFQGALAFAGKLWIFGGGNYVPTYQGLNDVWSSPDGANWTCAAEHAPWHGRIWFSAVVYRGCMWLLGGWSHEPNQNWNDVWYTADGANWKELKTTTIWSPRHEQSFYVHDDKLWIVGGNAWPLVNDVWSLQLPADWKP